MNKEDDKINRSLVDREDSINDHQVHFIYAILKNGKDKEWDINGYIEKQALKVNENFLKWSSQNKKSNGIGQKFKYDFLKKKKLLCYGGTAINNILPKYAQFYNKEYEVPDYDFYSHDALIHAKELADLYHAAGYEHVEAKSGVHEGTFKVFVNFIPMADITSLHKELFDSLVVYLR